MNLLAGATQEVEKVGEWASRQLDVVQLLQEEAQHWRVQLSQEDGRCALLAETSLEQQLLELGQEHGKALAQLHRLMKLPGQQLQQLGKALGLEQQLWEALGLAQQLGEALRLEQQLGEVLRLEQQLGEALGLEQQLEKALQLEHQLGKGLELQQQLGKALQLEQRPAQGWELEQGLRPPQGLLWLVQGAEQLQLVLTEFTVCSLA